MKSKFSFFTKQLLNLSKRHIQQSIQFQLGLANPKSILFTSNVVISMPDISKKNGINVNIVNNNKNGKDERSIEEYEKINNIVVLDPDVLVATSWYLAHAKKYGVEKKDSSVAESKKGVVEDINAYYLPEEECSISSDDIKETRFYLQVLAYLSENKITSSELIDFLTKKSNQSKEEYLKQLEETLKTKLGIGSILDKHNELLEQSIKDIINTDKIEEKLEIVADLLNEIGTDKKLTKNKLDSLTLMKNPHEVTNMFHMSEGRVVLIAGDDTFGIRVQHPNTKNKGGVFSSPMFLPILWGLPENFNELIEFYSKTNTGNIIKPLKDTGEMQIFKLHANETYLFQEVILRGKGFSPFIEVVSKPSSKELIFTVDARKELPVPVSKEVCVVLSYEEISNFNKYLQEHFKDFEGTVEEKIDRAFDVTREYILNYGNENTKLYDINGSQLNFNDFKNEHESTDKNKLTN